MTITHFLALICLACYCIASVCYLFSTTKKLSAPLSRFATGCFIAGFALQTALIVPFIETQEQIVPSQRGEYFFWLAWLLPCVFFVVRSKFESPVLGAFLAPSVTLLFASSSYLIHRDLPVALEQGSNILILMHVLPAMLAELSLLVVFIASAAFLVQERRIKKKAAVSVITRGPSLEALDGLSRKFVVIGFFSMGIAILSGAMWAVLKHISLWSGDFYQWAAVLAWLVLASLLFVRVSLGWAPQRIAKIALFLSATFMAAFILMALLGSSEFHLGYGE